MKIFENKKYILITLTAASSVIGFFINFFEEQIKSALKDHQVKIELFVPSNQVELNKRVAVEARIHSLGRDNLAPGILFIEADPLHISSNTGKSVRLGTISGSQTIEDLPELTAIKLSGNPVKITARYRSGEITADSNDIFINIVKPINVTHPHFDRSDTGRINLSGEWIIELGGLPGTMTIRQGTDNNINGSYSVPGGAWSSGAVRGHKDGKTFRAHFSVPGKENNETIRVAGYFELSQNGRLIELEGCAYHLHRSTEVYSKRGAEGVQCSAGSVFYDYWDVYTAVNFYAKSPFEKTE